MFRTLIFIGFSWRYHCVRSLRIRNYFGPHFPAFGQNTERYGVFSFQRTKVTPNTDTFHAVCYTLSSITLHFFDVKQISFYTGINETEPNLPDAYNKVYVVFAVKRFGILELRNRSYQNESRKITSHFELLTRKYL